MATKKQQEISLSNLTDKEALILKGVSINDINPIKGTLFGAWISAGDPHGIPAEFCKVQRDEGCIRVQLTMYSDSYCKGVQLLLVQRDKDIFGKIEWAKATRRRAGRNDRIENIMQSDWNDISNPNIANLQEITPIGKDGYGIENIVVEIAEQQKDAAKEEEKVREEKTEADEIEEVKGINKTFEKEDKTALAKQETNQRMKITPIDLPPVTIERRIDQLGITLTKTYDKFAEAPIQGVDAAGRRMQEINIDSLPVLNLNEIVLNPIKFDPREKPLDRLSKILTSIPKKIFSNLYEELFWKYLLDISMRRAVPIIVDEGSALESSFGSVSIHTDSKKIDVGIYSYAGEEITENPSFWYDQYFSTSDTRSKYKTPNGIVNISCCVRDGYLEAINENELIFSHDDFHDWMHTVGYYNTPSSFDNICPICHGEKIVRCDLCQGTGRQLYQEGTYRDGRPKMKTGKCPECYEKGFKPCKSCNETGKLDGGKGKLKIREHMLYDYDLLVVYKEKTVSSSKWHFLSESPNRLSSFKKLCDDIDFLNQERNSICERIRKANVELTKILDGERDQYIVDFVKNNTTAERYQECVDMGLSSDSLYDFVAESYINRSKIASAFYLRIVELGVSESISDETIKTLENLTSLSEKRDSLLDNIKQLGDNTEHFIKDLFSDDNVEVIFENQNELAFNGQHKQVENIIRTIGKANFYHLYYQNLNKAREVFSLNDSKCDRFLSFLEKHKIVDNLLKFDIMITSNDIFTLYYSANKNVLYYERLPKLNIIEDLVKKKKMKEDEIKQRRQAEERRKEEKAREERARKAEEQRQAHFSQSMDTLLDKEPTRKIGMFSKLFKTDSFKKTSDAEKTIKLMIYLAKADGTLDIDEKESLTSAILNTFSDAYTAENRQRFIDMLDSDSLPELTKEDMNFSTTKALKKAIKEMEEMAAIGGITPEEKNLLERVRELAGISR